MGDWEYVDPALGDDALRDEIVGLIRNRSVPLEPIPTGIAPAGKPPRGIRAVLFDLYGTLFVSGSGDIGVSGAEAADERFLQAFEAAGVQALRPSAGARARELFFSAISDTHRFRRERGCAWPEVDILSVWHAALTGLIDAGDVAAEISYSLLARLAVHYEILTNPVFPMPSAQELLDAFRGSGMPMGIVSNAQFYTPLLFPAFFHSHPADMGFLPRAMIFSYRMQEAKPSPRLFDAALAGLRHTLPVSPNEVLYVGNDMLNDIAAAAAAGMRTCLFAGDRRSLRLRPDDERAAGIRPDMVVTRLNDLHGW